MNPSNPNQSKLSTDWSIIPLDCRLPTHAWYAKARRLPNAILLESHRSRGSRYDTITALPSCLLISKNVAPGKDSFSSLASTQSAGRDKLQEKETLFVFESEGNEEDAYENTSWRPITGDPFQLINELMRKYRPSAPQPIEDAFCGGAMGYLSYDFGMALNKIPRSVEDDIQAPSLVWGIYEWALIVDNLLEKTSLVMSPDLHPKKKDLILSCLCDSSDNEFSDEKGAEAFGVDAAPQTNFDRSHYEDAFNQLKQYIRAGDCYQVNLAQRFTSQFEGDPFSIYQEICLDNHAPYSAYLDYSALQFLGRRSPPSNSEGLSYGSGLQSYGSGLQILSFSPERFLRVENGQVITEPIKGTRPRGNTPEEDLRLAAELLISEKDLAENLMIVDLLRNDLGKCCVPGSIEVTNLRKLKSFDNVHHLVSSITGNLKQESNPMDLLKACFPGGSITGAPKVRAMQIIGELEPHRRSVYCGTIGYYSFNELLDCNIAIRTLLCMDNHLYYWGGGGIVNDSEVDKEYQECLDKIDFIYRKLSAASCKN